MKTTLYLIVMLFAASFVGATCTPPLTNIAVATSFPAAGTTAFAAIPAISGCRISMQSLVASYEGSVSAFENVTVKVLDATTCTATSTGTILWEGRLGINTYKPSDTVTLHGISYWSVGVASHLQCIQFSTDVSGVSFQGFTAIATYQ